MFSKTFTHLTKVPKDCVKEWLKGIKTVICDGDGVLWKMNKVIKGSPDVFRLLRSTGRKLLIVTNNTTVSSAKMLEMINKMGYGVKDDEFLTPSQTIVNFLKMKDFDRKVYVLGEPGLFDELAKGKIRTIPNDKSVVATTQKAFSDLAFIDPEVGAVIVGKDDNFSVPKLIMASSYLQNIRTLFLGTSLEYSYPMGDSMIIGAGAMITSLKSIAQRKPTILGKPNPLMISKFLADGTIDPKTTLLIGDSLSSDMMFARNCGFQTLFVGSGVNNVKDVEELCKSKDEKKHLMIPDTYLPSLSELQPFLS